MVKKTWILFFSGLLPIIGGVLLFILWAPRVLAQSVNVNATVPAICGNGAVEGAESCDGAALDGATCITRGFTGGVLSCAGDCSFNTTLCTNDGGGGPVGPPPPPPPPPPAVCGNGQVELGEQCDDANAVQGDGCFVCQIEIPVCGNGVKEVGEGCDDGNVIDNDFCSAQCQPRNVVCGNNIVEVGEQCDDGNGQNADGCSAQCIAEQAVCGNGQVQGAEQCDDGNLQNNDGCNAQCRVEPPLAVCGNGQLENAEQCDDGNLQNNDGCNAQCRVEFLAAVCGNGQVENGEQCDDNNVQNGDGCSAQCQAEGAPPVVQPPVIPPAGQADGGGAANQQRVLLAKLLFWIADGSIQVFPDANNQVKTLTGDSVTIAIHEHELPVQAVRQIVIQVGEKQYAFTFNAADGRYYVDVPLGLGAFDSRIRFDYDDGTGDTLALRLLGLPYGRVLDEDDHVLSGAKVTLLDADTKQVWNGAALGQANPVITAADGLFAFIVPNGEYVVVVEKEEYHTRETLRFRVTDHVVNGDYVLIKKVKELLEALQELGDDATTQEKATVIASVVTQKVAEQTKIFTQKVTDAATRVNEVSDDPTVEQAVKNVVAPTTVGISAAIIIPSLWSSLLPLLRYIFLQPLLLLGRRKRREWGVVYNSLTKLPVDLAVVRLIDATTKRVKQSRVTDMNGRYVFIAEPGDYMVEVTKAGFTFPSLTLKGIRNDGDFVDLYHGEAINVASDNVNITPNIPLDPPGATKTPTRIVWEKRLRVLQHAISIIGITLAAVSFYITPTWLVGFLLLLHIGIYAGFTRFVQPSKPKGWGIVYNEQNKQPLAGAVVRLFTKEYNKLVATQVTDNKGRYAFLVGPSTYYVTSEKGGYEPVKTSEIAIKEKEQQSFLKEDVGMKEQRAS